MNFEEKAKAILQNQKSTEKIKKFISLCSELKTNGLHDDYYFQAETSDDVKTNRKAFKLIRQLITLQMVKKPQFVSHKKLVEGLEIAFQFIEFNESLKTGGKPSQLSIGDMFRLMSMQMYFEIIFPKYSGKFTRGNILHQLGEALTDKPLSGNINQKLEKMSDNLKELSN